MLKVKILPNNQILINESVVSDSVKHEKIKFDFSKEWEGYSKTAVFSYEDQIYNIILNEDNEFCTGENECYIPYEVIKSPCFTVSVFGVDREKRITTTRSKIAVLESGYELGDAPSDPTPDEYSQITQIMLDSRDMAQSVRTDADRGVFNGKSAYELAVKNGFLGTEKEWLESLKGDDANVEELTNTLCKSNLLPLKLTADTLLFQKSIVEGINITENKNTLLIYDINISAGDIIHFDDYVNYKYYIKRWINNAWGDFTVGGGWRTSDTVWSEGDERLVLYVRRNDNTEVTENDYNTVLSDFSLIPSSYIPDRFEKTEAVAESNKDVILLALKNKRFKHLNHYDSSKVISYETKFTTFDIPINVSRENGLYGYNINPSSYIINNDNGKTYYVSPNGLSNHDGTSPDTPFNHIQKALNMEDANTIILLDGEYISNTHFYAGCEIAKSVNIIGYGNVIINNGSNEPMVVKNACYFENIRFTGGKSALSTLLQKELCTFVDCVFEKSTVSNGFSAVGGNYIMYHCSANDNMRDGFNYHSNTTSYPVNAVEIECNGFFNGENDSTQINNCSTMHETGGKIIRIGCEYGYSRGGVITDADGAKSINVSCIAYSTLTNETNRNGNFVCIDSDMWLYDCISHGSVYDTINDSGYLYSNKTFNKVIEI